MPIVPSRKVTGQKFIATAVYNPSLFHGFERVIFSGALFEYELMYNLWRDFYGIEWIKSSLMDVENIKHKAPLRVKYIFPELNWSKYAGQKPFGEGTVMDAVNELARQEIKDQDALWISNKDQEKPESKWVECPYGNRGMNKFREYGNLVYTPAYNHSTPYYKFAEWAGLKKIVMLSQNVSHCYQTVSRLRFRDGQWVWVEESVLVVPCKSIIDPIAGYFENIIFEEIQGELATQLRESVKDGRADKESTYIKSSGDTRSDNAVRIDRHTALKKLKTSLLQESISLKNTKNQKNSNLKNSGKLLIGKENVRTKCILYSKRVYIWCFGLFGS